MLTMSLTNKNEENQVKDLEFVVNEIKSLRTEDIASIDAPLPWDLLKDDGFAQKYYRISRDVLNRNGKTDITCAHTYITYNIPPTFGWLKKGDKLYPKSIIKDGRTGEKTYQPLSLQHLAAAKSVGTLILHNLSELYGIFNIVKDKALYVRVGPEHSRKQFKFKTIIKHLLYLKIKEPLVTEDLYMMFYQNPTPICRQCGFCVEIEKLESFSRCNFCALLKWAVAPTPMVEKPYHCSVKDEILHRCSN